MSTKNTLFTYFSTLALFIGTGFISGAIVHTGDSSQIPKYLSIGAVGIGLFIAGSFAQEAILGANNLSGAKAIKFFIFSLLLSIGIGMMSGGTQHFTDFPLYSSYLVPFGLIVSYFAFLLKNNFQFTKNLVIAGIILVAIAGIGHFGLNSYAKNLVAEATKEKLIKESACKTSFDLFVIKVSASAGHEETVCPVKISMKMETKMEIHDMTEMVTDDKSFVQNMIPHHIEAINTSKIIVQSTKDAEIKKFAENVIIDQQKEVELMKNLYKAIADKEYQNDNSYKPMMSDMNSQMGAELDRAYIFGMIEHHDGAIKMANKILTITKSVELKALGNDIVANQTKEITLLNTWLKTKFETISSSSAISSSLKSVTNEAEPHAH